MSSTSIIERHLTIMEILADEPGGLALGAISERAALPKSVAHRMLSSLIASGYVVQLGNRNYRLTMKLITLGFHFLGKMGLAEVCQTALQQVADEAEELVRMTLVDNDRLVWIAKAQGAKGPLLIDPIMGRKVVVHATASGKIWLASLPLDHALKVVLRDGFGTAQTHGPNVIQTPEKLIAELRKVHERGFAIAWEEADPGICAVAVGIPADARVDAPLIGTVSVAGPIFRLPRKRLEGFVPSLKRAARDLAGIGTVLSTWRSDTLLNDGKRTA